MSKFRNITLKTRGNTLIIVLAILTVLTILASTTYYISTLENISAANFSSGVKAKFAALGGLPVAEDMFFENKQYTALNQRWARSTYNIKDLPGANLPSKRVEPSNSGGEKIRDLDAISLDILRGNNRSKDNIFIDDESSRININAAGMLDSQKKDATLSETSTFDVDLAKYLEEVIKNELPGINPSTGGVLAEAIIKYRYGPDGKPGQANYDDDGDGEIDEPDEFICDPRMTPNGDDRPFKYLNDLFNIKGVDKGVIQAIAPYVTVFSSTDNLVYINGESIAPLNINKASVDKILKQLKIIYQDADEEMLIQYTINCVDARDKDLIPTVYKYNGETILGIEITPYIDEVYADSKSFDEEGDDGQYVEIYNPYSRDIDVTGWVLTALNRVYLSGKIKAGGYLIVTDDYDEQQDPHPEDDENAYGSFFDIFGIVPDENLKRMIEFPFFDIDNKSGTVTLEDAKGNLIDIFKYRGGENSFGYKSFQRNDPRLRYCELVECTPYSNNSDFNPPESYKEMLADREKMDKAFLSPVELMKVYAGYVSSQRGAEAVEISDYPQIRESSSHISSNVIDLFKTIEGYTINSSRRSEESHFVRISGINGDRRVSSVAISSGNNEVDWDKVDILVGLININTANNYVFKALPGLTDRLSDDILKYAVLTENNLSVPFERVSDLLRKDDIWGNMKNSERIDSFSKIYNLLTVRSNVCSIKSEGFDFAETGNKPLSKTFVLAMIGYENGNRFIYDLRLSDYFVKPIILKNEYNTRVRK